MKGKRYATEQKVRILRSADQEFVSIQDACREAGISEQSFHRWKREFGMMALDQAKQLKELQANARLKRMLADEMLGEEILKEALEKSCEPWHKRELAVSLVGRGRYSARLACRHLGLRRSTLAYEANELRRGWASWRRRCAGLRTCILTRAIQ